MDRTKDIIEIIDSLAGSCSSYEVFCDWVKCMALAIQNSMCMIHDSVWKRREDDYIRTIQRYEDGKEKFAAMFDMLVETMETNFADVLGEIYMKSGMGNKNTGQFFTPFHVSEMCASLTLPKEDDGKPIMINEPSCGGGGMIIAAAKILQDRGISWQFRMDVVAQDLDWKAVYMCYVQLSLLGIKAVVVQGDTLSEPYIQRKVDRSRIFKTPAKMGLIV